VYIGKEDAVVYGIIMAGGRGERFWPLSRAEKPKQFLRLTSERTMLDETIERIRPLIPIDNVRIVTGESMAQMVQESTGYLQEKHVLAEPFGRNTSLAIALAAAHLYQTDKKAVMVVLSADHLIRPAEKLLKVLKEGSRIAAGEDVLITIGIVPSRPETAYGYIKLGQEYECEGDCKVFEVSAFTEKPRAPVAQEYYYSRKYFWNSGMFIWSVSAILKACEKYQPDCYEHLMTYSKSIGTDREISARKELYEKSSDISIDYAILEKADNVLAIRADILWDDVGSWKALERYKERDSDNNVVVGNAATFETFETTVYNDSSELVACLGVSDLVVVRTSDITLVAHKSKLGRIKELLAKLGEDEKTRGYL